MNVPERRRALVAGATSMLSLIAFLTHSIHLHAETPVLSGSEIVVTPFRSEMEISRSGSAITVIRADDIQKWGAQTLADVMRAVPGVSITQNGGPAGLATLRLRGAEARHSMVMIDGIRIGDPASTGGEFDLSAVAANDIERIEILRGPQSALYGSEAMGGVVNIITRKGKRDPKASLTIEGGSYGARSFTGSVSGGTRDVDYAISASGFGNDGFSGYGHNIPRITRNLASPLEHDPAQKASFSARFGWQPQQDMRFDFGMISMLNNNHYDLSSGDDPFNRTRNQTTQIWSKATFDLFDGQLRSSAKVFANRTDRHAGNVGYFDPNYMSYGPNSLDYRGDRYGIDVQNDLKLGSYGLLIFGIASEAETAFSSNQALPRGSATRYITGDASQNTQSAYVMHQLPLGERLSVSLGSRIDYTDPNRFATWRATASYAISETGTKLRSSIGTGAKSPSLYQRFSEYGSTTLRPEDNIGFDIGIDQDFLDKRLQSSTTAFETRYQNLINFGSNPNCTMMQNTNFGGCYFNVDQARSRGVEQTLVLALVPDLWRVKTSYTFMLAEDQSTHTALLRRPQHQAMASLTYLGFDRIEIEPRLTFVGHRIDIYYDDATFLSTRVALAPYAKLDVLASYKFDDTYMAYIRAENLTNAHYEDIRGFGTAGRSVNVGLRATW